MLLDLHTIQVTQQHKVNLMKICDLAEEERDYLTTILEICGGKKEDVGLDELGEGGKGVVSKIGGFGGDLGSVLLGDGVGEEDEKGFIVIGEVSGVLFGGGEGGDGGRL
ncbi:hypothetical protein Tco_0929407 [Tanacetum coccineum]